MISRIPRPTRGPICIKGLTLAMYVPTVARANGEIRGVAMRHIVVNPWWMGALALVATGTMFGAWMRYLPSLTAIQRTVGNVAPQRTS